MLHIRVFALTTVLALAASASIPAEKVKDHTSNGRIVGGYPINIFKRPHQVQLLYKECQLCYFQHLCGGSIISEKIILTAAHCIYGYRPEFTHVIAGTSDSTGKGVVMPVKKIVCHENYTSFTYMQNDIAIIVLAAELPLNNINIKPIKMIEARPVANEIAFTLGWGRTAENQPRSDQLLEVQVLIISNEVCEALYSGRNISKSMLCAGVPNGGKDSCAGDSGGPLLVNGVLAGVVSWGDGCARAESPGVYASVADLRPWIDAAVRVNL